MRGAQGYGASHVRRCFCLWSAPYRASTGAGFVCLVYHSLYIPWKEYIGIRIPLWRVCSHGARSQQVFRHSRNSRNDPKPQGHGRAHKPDKLCARGLAAMRATHRYMGVTQMTQREMTICHLTICHLTECHLTNCQLTNCQLTNCQLTNNQVGGREGRRRRSYSLGGITQTFYFFQNLLPCRHEHIFSLA